MRFLSVCSGVEAASLAWEPLGWECAAVSEVEPFPSAVLAHRYPDVPNLGDMTSISGDDLERIGPIDLLVGGTPCQSFSVAGNRGGLDDARGRLALAFADLAARSGARWVVWENVPGVLSSGEGWDFAAFVSSLVERGFCCAWRVLDAQGFGVPQRRRRVFVVGHLGDGARARAVLSLTAGGARHIEARGGERAENAGGFALGDSGDAVAATLMASSGRRRMQGFDEAIAGRTVAFAERQGGRVGYDANEGRTFGPLGGPGGKPGQGYRAIAGPGGVRRLTPRECDRLQGFPDDWTRVPYRGKPAELCPDGPRYKAIGNSMAVPVMRWIGRGIEAAA